MKEAFGIWVEIAAGWYASVMLPNQVGFSTNWLGNTLEPEF
jgi:hypothetical protein